MSEMFFRAGLHIRKAAEPEPAPLGFDAPPDDPGVTQRLRDRQANVTAAQARTAFARIQENTAQNIARREAGR